MSLDRIENREDCIELITKPLHGSIEYESSGVKRIVDYCGRNPFYIHLVCSKVFEKCILERRTFISEADIQKLFPVVVKELGATNFSHFWTDNPELDQSKQLEFTAENCLVLTCIAMLGCRYDNVDDIVSTQQSLELRVSDQIYESDFRKILSRLHNRGVLQWEEVNQEGVVTLPIFSDWLKENARRHVLPIWIKHCENKTSKVEEKAITTFPAQIRHVLPIPEEQLLDVSRSLVYLGSQKDVSEISTWLKQFDDDLRIETAFMLLRRLAEKGFITAGAKLQALSTIQEAILSKRQQIGDGAWKMIRGKRENLCITFVDSETKSGGTTARELAQRMRPGKCSPYSSIGKWLSLHTKKDALLVIVDDFAGTGGTISRGLSTFLGGISDRAVNRTFLNEGRILCYILYSFPEAIDRLRNEFPNIEFLVAKVFDDSVRALNADSGIFDTAEEVDFAKEILIQYGRELTPQFPLGYGDLGALVAFHNCIPNNTLPIFWSNGNVNEKPWRPLFPRL